MNFPQQGPGEHYCPTYHLGDDKNGNIVCYADDTTFTNSDFDAASLSSKLTEKYKIMNNQLKLNDDKNPLRSWAQVRLKEETC